LKLVSGTTQRSVIESRITNGSSQSATVRRENFLLVGSRLWGRRCADCVAGTSWTLAASSFLVLELHLLNRHLIYKLLMSIKIEIRGSEPHHAVSFLRRNRIYIFPGPTEIPQSSFAWKYYQQGRRKTEHGQNYTSVPRRLTDRVAAEAARRSSTHTPHGNNK